MITAKELANRIILECFPKDYITYGERERLENLLDETLKEIRIEDKVDTAFYKIQCEDANV